MKSDISAYFRALADRKRLNIVQFLAQHEGVTVTEISAELRMSQPLISWHLRMLRRAGIVKTRRVGRQVFCSLNKRSLESYQRQIIETFKLDMDPSVEEKSQGIELEALHRG